MWKWIEQRLKRVVAGKGISSIAQSTNLFETYAQIPGVKESEREPKISTLFLHALRTFGKKCSVAEHKRTRDLLFQPALRIAIFSRSYPNGTESSFRVMVEIAFAWIPAPVQISQHRNCS